MLALGALMLVVCVAAPVASAAQTVDVLVGYQDQLRANPAASPTPFAPTAPGVSPAVKFFGCTGTGCEFDASAVEIINNTAITQTIGKLPASPR